MMENTLVTPTEALQAMTPVQEALLEAESFLNEHYQFRHNLLSGKTEFMRLPDAKTWEVLTELAINSIILHAKREGIGGKRSPKSDIEELLHSNQVPLHDPIREFLDELPQWDGKNHVAQLFGRLPGVTSEQLSWLSTWFRSAVAHWLGMDTLHGNECVPVLIGEQGCGKSTFAVRLLPEKLRIYFLDHINLGNKFDSEMALTHNLLVNIDEFANMGNSQQGRLKQMLSKVKVNGRPIFGKAQEDRRRYASFLATTNEAQPLCDETGSRRYLCIKIPKGQLIDNETPIDYAQLFAQLLHELRVEQVPYWFSNAEVARIQRANLPYQRSEKSLEQLVSQCYQLPEGETEGSWLSSDEVLHGVKRQFPQLRCDHSTKVRLGKVLRFLGCESKHTREGAVYRLVLVAA